MRRLLLKVLALAVFLNTVVGLPLHAAGHLIGDTVQARSGPAIDAGSAEHGDEHDDRAEATCAWCLAQAESSGAPPCAVAAGRLGHGRDAPAAPGTEAARAFSAGLWSSAPRGPPSA